MKLGKQPSIHALTRQEPHHNTNCYGGMSACRGKPFKLLKIWDTLRQPMKQPSLDSNGSMAENAGHLHYDLKNWMPLSR